MTGLTIEMELPQGVSATSQNGTVTLKGAKGEVSRAFPVDVVTSKVEGSKIILSARRSSKKERKVAGSIRAHLKNMIQGVTEGHHYTMKILSGHFPMTVTVNGTTFTVKNFIGEKTPRTVTLPSDVKVQVKGQEIDIESCNKESAGAAVTKIEQLTKRVAFDRRIFQDGIVLVK